MDNRPDGHLANWTQRFEETVGRYAMSNPTLPRTMTRGRPNTAMSATHVVLGVWLFLSAFVWEHSPGSETNTWVVGLVIAAVALAELVSPGVRLVNTAAAVWLFFSSIWLYDAALGTAWHNMIIATVVFILSILPLSSRHGRSVV
jgi:hypothetical protein